VEDDRVELSHERFRLLSLLSSKVGVGFGLSFLRNKDAVPPPFGLPMDDD
jgi:hypothetical protein